MRKRLFQTALPFLLLALLVNAAQASDKLADTRSWVVFYGNELPTSIPEYDLYIFDSHDYPKLTPLKNKGKKVVGYLSVGEVAKYESYFNEIKEAGLTVDENENWPGSFRVKIADPKWHDIILNKLIPKILAKGFEGLFLDTIDTAEYLQYDKGMTGQVEGAEELIKKIRKRYPKMVIIMNNGLFLTGRVGNDIDALVVEDIYTMYDFKKKKYRLAKKSWTRERLVPVKEFQKMFKKPVLPLEYLKPSDKKAIKKISDEARSNGFILYISDIDLKSVFFHPHL